jgi:hypothetical protein
VLLVRRAGFLCVIVGAVIALISLGSLSWYAIAGPHVVSDLSPTSADPGSVVVLVPSNIGRAHSWVTWLLFVACVVAALIANVPHLGARSVTRVIAPILAGVLILFAIARVAIPSLAFSGPGWGLPDGTGMSLHVGFWLALVGCLLIAVSAVLGPRKQSSDG